MLERFTAIANVGRFHNYQYEIGHDCSRLTLVYGDNSAGKTTLASILDSLRENNPSIILRRTTLPGTDQPRVSLCFSGQTYEFINNEWSPALPYETLEVFYSDFVSRNVYSGVSVDLDHGRNLCEFFLGRRAVEAVVELLEVDADARAAKTQLNEQEKFLDSLIKPPDNLETFTTIEPDPEIDEKLESTRKKIEELSNLKKILDRPLPKQVDPIVVDAQALKGIFSAGFDGLTTESIEIVRHHIQERLDERGEEWLAYGTVHIEEDMCPFCGQDVTQCALVTALCDYFSETYTEYSRQLSSQISEQLDVLNLENFLKKCAEFEKQILIAASWSEQYEIHAEDLHRMLEEAQQEWAEGIELLRAALTEKRRNPLTRIEEERAWKITPFFERSMRIINRINDILTECSESAAGYKRSLERIDSEQLEVEFNHLQNVKARSESYAKELIAKREHFIQERRRLDDRRRALKSDIDSAAQTIVTKYQDDINHYLEYFGSTTRITEVEAKYPGGKATVSYRIVVGGHNIPLGFSEQEPCFDTVLSEGEKVTLALAFFMARLKDRSVEGMTIVFDDPVNSFGRERRTLTEEAIQNLYERKAQLVVLTHDERLAAMIWRDTRIKHPDIMCLCVEQAGDESKIREWDVEQATTSDYVKDYLALDNYIQNGGDHQAVAARIRPYLEARIRYHFPGPPFTSRDSLGIMISKITASQPGSKLESIKDKVPELNVINRSVLPPHHDMEPDLGVAELTPAEVRIFAEKAINVLG